MDDVHLTSYRVLANLNRTDGTKRTEKDATTGGDDPNSEDPYLHSERKKNIKRGVTNTLESNLGKSSLSFIIYFLPSLLNRLRKASHLTYVAQLLYICV